MTAKVVSPPFLKPGAPALVEAPYWRLWLACVLGYAAIGMTLQVMSGYAHAMGAGDIAAGFVVTAGSFATMLSRPIAGRFVDRAGPRGVAMIGAQLGVIGGLGHWFADNLVELTAARLLLGAGEGALFTAAIGWVMARAAPDQRGRIAGQFGISLWIGMAVGPAIGALLLTLFGHRAIWLAASVLPSVSWALLASTSRPASPAPTHAQADVQANAEEQALAGVGRTRASMFPRSAWRPGATNMLAGIGYGALAAFLVPLIAARFRTGQDFAFTVFGTAFILTRILAAPWVDRLGVQRVLVAACGLEAIGLGTLAFAPTLATAFACIALIAAGLSLLYPCLARWVSDLARDHERTTALGALTSAWDLGLALGGPLAGAMSAISLQAPFELGALAAAVAGLSVFLRAR